MCDIPDMGLAMLTTDDMSGDEQNRLDLKGLPILLIPAFEAGGELYCSIVGEVLGDTGCLTGDFFCKVDEGEPTELEELEFFGDEVLASGEVLLVI